mmetsp:Transcript_46136/g.99637  ORF Transcript_46136/g.99637 Transcript_46136/m.99637 type:complete len:86 (-) Transcript_46136:151-408(-)
MTIAYVAVSGSLLRAAATGSRLLHSSVRGSLQQLHTAPLSHALGQTYSSTSSSSSPASTNKNVQKCRLLAASCKGFPFACRTFRL